MNRRREGAHRYDSHEDRSLYEQEQQAYLQKLVEAELIDISLQVSDSFANCTLNTAVRSDVASIPPLDGLMKTCSIPW